MSKFIAIILAGLFLAACSGAELTRATPESYPLHERLDDHAY